MNKKIDFLAIGDIVSEPYIRIIDAETTCDLNREYCKLSFRFGDKIPYESAEVCRATGNSPNASVCAARLGLHSFLISYTGDDSIGKGNIEELAINKVNTDYLEIVPKAISNYNFVLWYDTERTILVNHKEFPYSFSKDIPEPKWIYLSSLGQNSIKYHQEIISYLQSYPEVKLAFQPGTFQMELGYEVLKDVYQRADILLCNKQEAQKILQSEEKNEIQLMKNLLNLGPKMVVVTDGLNGAYASDGVDFWHIPVYPQAPYERTGAGDAFSSTFVSALILGKSLPDSLIYSGINAMSVVQQVGPHKGLLTVEQIEEVLKICPAEYKPTKIN